MFGTGWEVCLLPPGGEGLSVPLRNRKIHTAPNFGTAGLTGMQFPARMIPVIRAIGTLSARIKALLLLDPLKLSQNADKPNQR